MNKFNTKSLVYASVLLAIAIASQFLKNLSVYITGPIVNTCLVICVIMAGLWYAVALSVITPITSVLITGNPLMMALPLIIPCIMLGNVLLVICIYLFKDKMGKKIGLIMSMGIGSIIKALFMGIAISLIIIPNMLPEAMMPKMKVFQTTFSLTQLITSVTGCILAYIILIPLKKISRE